MISGLVTVLSLVILLEFAVLASRRAGTSGGASPRARQKRGSPDEGLGTFFSGETYDYSGEYRIVRFHRSEGAVFKNSWEWNDVTLATQGSLDKLSYLTGIADRFDGPLSVSIFCPGYDAAYADDAIHMLRKCYPKISENVMFHLVYPAEQPADLAYTTGWRDLECADFIYQLKAFTSTENEAIIFPHNVLRNVARSAVHSEFFLLLDIDLAPSLNLRQSFVDYANENNLWEEENDLVVYVLPAFEQKAGTKMPKDKDELINAIEKGNIRPFHNETCFPCHRPEKYEHWKSTSEKFIAFEAPWEEAWEPFYIGRRSLPYYDERFKGFGFDRIQQVCELYVAGYTLKVLSNSFVVHDNWKRPAAESETTPKDSFNWFLFNYHFKDELQRKYNTSKTCSPLPEDAQVMGPRQGKPLNDRKANDDFNRYQIQQNMMGKPVAIKNEPPFTMDVPSNPLALLPNHDHRKLKVLKSHIRTYSHEELQEIYQKGLSSDGIMKEFRVPKDDDLTWEFEN